eukprot:CAMPEP_0119209136 /NCGR_PEP_ID=MMETSP1327-20130426/1209_1 /TAXON_ID=38833 /ORGANISM="Micromonas pusilla, Strain RCC2306" /LENGTH=61 /DNA_ID=CAMNT_0007205863 /DNA_START=87 /DNA_END=269 /DNA_ORIENTATION=+
MTLFWQNSKAGAEPGSRIGRLFRGEEKPARKHETESARPENGAAHARAGEHVPDSVGGTPE